MRSIMLKWRPWVIPDKARPRTPSKSKDPKGSDVSWEAPMNSMLAHKLPIQTSSFKKTPVILGGKLPQERTFAMSKFRLLYAQVQVHCNVYRNFVYACIRKKNNSLYSRGQHCPYKAFFTCIQNSNIRTKSQQKHSTRDHFAANAAQWLTRSESHRELVALFVGTGCRPVRLHVPWVRGRMMTFPTRFES